MKDIDFDMLIKEAINARKNAYTPYSHFKVGAALLCADGTVIKGCNVENASFGATNCAERTAIFSAVAQGKKEFSAIAVVGGKEDGKLLPICAPCGICRQVLTEFCSPDFPIVLGTDKEYEVYKLKDILPLSFTESDLNKK